MRRLWWPLALLSLFLAACGSRREQPEQNASATANEPLLYTINGSISLQDNGDPTGAHVFCAGTSFDAYADEQGAYSISAVPPGRYRVLAQMPGYATTPISEIVLLPINPRTGPPVYDLAEVQLRRSAGADAQAAAAGGGAKAALGTLSGRVVLGDGRPADLVRVTLEGTSFKTTTDASGRFNLINVEPGRYRVAFQSSGYELYSEQVSIGSGGITSLTQDVVLQPLPRRGILGKVLFVDENDQPLQAASGAIVRLAESSRTASVGIDGEFEVMGLAPGAWTLLAECRGYTLIEPAHVTVGDGEATAVLTLRRTDAAAAAGASIIGRVQLQGATPSVPVSLAGTRIALAGTSHAATSDMQGRFSISGMPPGNYAVVVTREGYKMLQVEDVEVAEDGPTDLGTLTLERDVVKPEVIAVEPPQNERRNIVILPTVTLQVRFSKPMNSDSVQRAFSMAPRTVYRTRMIAGKSGGGQDVLEVILENTNPANALRFNTSYRCVIGTGAQDIEGTALEEPYAFDIRTAGLRVLSSSPEEGSLKALTGSSEPMVIRFNGFVHADTINDRTVSISPRPFAMPYVWQIRRSPGTGWTELRLPISWEGRRNYTITLGRGILASDGTRLDQAPVKIRFQTGELPATPSSRNLRELPR